MGKISRLKELLRRTDETNATMNELRTLLPELRELLAYRTNLDRLGPRLDLIDSITPRLDLIDSIAPRLNEIDRLASEVSSSTKAMREIEDLNRVVTESSVILRKFLDTNHVIAEDVRLDVDTISAVVLSLQKSINELADKLPRVGDGGTAQG
jgi:hypothetical protein